MRRAVSKFIPNKLGRLLPENPAGQYKVDQNSVDEFYITLDDPHKLWAPGEEVLGQVILVSRKNLANVAISFCLAGYVRINALPHSKLRPIKHILFTHTINIFGPDSPASSENAEFTNGLYKGEHRFPFIVKLPTKRIFTSIDFGKGAIAYSLLTVLRSAEVPLESALLSSNAQSSSDSSPFHHRALAKLNNKTLSYEKTITLINPIDVAELPPPKRKRLIIKDPRVGKLLRVPSSNSTVNTMKTMSTSNSDVESTTSPSTAHAASPLENTPNLNPSQHASVASLNAGISPALGEHRLNTIRVLMEIAQRGYLRGELIPIKISINHLKKIQDSRGIIVTLVRVCRIDYGPDSSYESFRKDLQQLVVPLFVDPSTFSLEISTSLRVPPDAFPTISGCPMVSFQYFIEVMLNLSGKSFNLAAPLEQPKDSIVSHEEQGASPGNSNGGSYSFHPLTQQRSEYINTDKFKRLKKFLQMTSEIIIGTHRLEKPQTAIAASSDTPTNHMEGSSSSPMSQSHSPVPVNNFAQATRSGQPPMSLVSELAQLNEFGTPPYPPESRPQRNAEAQSSSIPTYDDIAIPSPTPQFENLSEKQRMQQHEASLLPSEPNFDDSDGEDDPELSTMVGMFSQDAGSPADISEATTNHTTTYGDPSFSRLSPRNQALNALMDSVELNEAAESEEDKDYVPTYKASADDELIQADMSTQN